jgi:hypothetical protein
MPVDASIDLRAPMTALPFSPRRRSPHRKWRSHPRVDVSLNRTSSVPAARFLRSHLPQPMWARLSIGDDFLYPKITSVCFHTASHTASLLLSVFHLCTLPRGACPFPNILCFEFPLLLYFYQTVGRHLELPLVNANHLFPRRRSGLRVLESPHCSPSPS